jgi:hypothetical protein
MKVTTRPKRHMVIIPAISHPSDWPVKDIEDCARKAVTRHYGEKARIVSVHADRDEIKVVVEVDEIHIDYREEQGEQ